MSRSRWPALALMLVLGLGLQACMLVALVDNRDCSDHIFDELYDKPYRLSMREGGATDERGFSFRLRGDCTLRVPDSFKALGVTGIELKNAHSARKATAIIHTDSEDAEGNGLRCSAPFSTYEAMDFICPPELKGRSYRLAPLDIQE